MNKNTISIIIPVYNSENIILKTVASLLTEIKKNNYEAEIILINDGSPDQSWRVIKTIAEEHSIVKSINLVKNYGQHNAVLCGFKHSKNNYIITMDDDLQNPPSEIKHLVDKISESDYDLVFGKFKEKKHAAYRKIGSKLIGYLNYKVFNKPKNITLTNFRIIRRDLIQRVLKHKTAYPYIPGMLLMYSSKMANTMVEHHDREDGHSNYTMKKIVSLMSRLLINYSSYPLRMLSSIGIIVSFLSFFLGSMYLIKGLVTETPVQGWTTLVVLTSFLGGFIIVLLGVIGEYLSRILDQISSEDSYFVKEIIE